MDPKNITERAARLAKRMLDPTGPIRAGAKRLGADAGPTEAAPDVAPPAPRPAVFDQYTAPGDLDDLGVLLMPLAAYHGKELGAVADALAHLGHSSTFLVEEDSVEAIDPHLGEHPRILATKEKFNRSALGTFDAFVAMNDWGAPSRAIYHLARVREVPSVAKVEGVQDFTDIDTGRIRLPYLAADHVLVQGENDTKSLERKNLHVVGNSNMETAWNTGPGPGERNGQVVINSNFTYGVLTDKRDMFLEQAVAGIEAMGLEPVISQHPVDRPLRPEFAKLVSDRSMSELLPISEAIVTRFSTVPFEAIAYGTPFVYFNPHSEKVPTFAAPDVAFRHVHDREALTNALTAAVANRENYRELAEPYFRAQISMTETPSANRAAQAIRDIAYG